MGGVLTRNRNNGDDSGESSSQSAYRYPPKSGSYFGTHFIMGGERFDSPQPGEYLFGDSDELNFLGSKPVPFPYPVPSGNDPTKTLKSLVYVRKDSLRLVKSPSAAPEMVASGDGASLPYNLEFIFDSDVKCKIKIHYFASEEMSNGHIVYQVRETSMSSETFHYKQGAGQAFSQPSHTILPGKYPEEDWQYSFEKDVYPIAIHCSVDEEENVGHSHVTYAVIEKSSEGSFTMKPLKQKQVVDGLCYLLQEIYGVENKNMERVKDIDPDDEVEDSGAECVICMSDMRDTLILPCRHLCLCSSCADSLRYQASMCPICRVKFRALLQIRAMRKKSTTNTNNSPPTDTEENLVNQEGVPNGYEAISLIEALNGQVVPPVNNEGVHLQITGPPTLYSVEKKGQKESKNLVQGPIEYQKEMDTDKESSKGTLEKKKEKDKVLDTTPDVTSTEPNSDATPDDSGPRKITKDVVTTPLKSTMVTVRCSPDGSIKTETKISPVKETELLPPKPSHKPTEKRGGFKTNMAISRLTVGLSTGDMADDEREDSSEPEVDYDETEDLGTELATLESSAPPAKLGSQGDLKKIQTDRGDDHKYSAAECGENYDPLLADLHSSGTEGSSFGSNSSSHALLEPPVGQVGTATQVEVFSETEGTLNTEL